MNLPTHRLLLQAPLRPWQGTRFRPTGFPDVGAAEYSAGTGQTHLLVESVQSMANRLESAVWDAASDSPIAALEGLPYVRLQHPQHGMVTSLLEPHRLASPYLFAQLQPLLLQELGGPPTGEWSRSNVARALFRLDPNSLIHGVFLVGLKPPARMPRLLSSFIEAREVAPVSSGGVKLDALDPSGAAEQGKGHIPFSLREYCAGQITAYFNIDLLQLREWGLSEPAQQLLVDLCLLKIRRFLDRGLRLRSACDLQAGSLQATHPQDWPIPDQQTLRAAVAELIARLRKTGELGAPLELTC